MSRNKAPVLAGGKTPAAVRKKTKAPSLIGTKKESSLHRALKFHYSGPEGDTETAAGSYVCDGRTCDGELVEVQTGSFAPLKEKVKNLTLTGKVRIIHPIFVKKTIELYDADGTLIHRRKSPKRGCAWDFFRVLVYAPELALLKNLAIELALVEVIEKRVDDGKGSWRRKGIRIADRYLAAWHDFIILKKPEDYYRFIPYKKNEQFTAKDLGEKAGIDTALARKAVYAFNKMGFIKQTGKRGRSLLYKTAK